MKSQSILRTTGADGMKSSGLLPVVGASELAVVLIVTAAVAEPDPLTLTSSGATVQAAAFGAPLQSSETWPLNPAMGFRVSE